VIDESNADILEVKRQCKLEALVKKKRKKKKAVHSGRRMS